MKHAQPNRIRFGFLSAQSFLLFIATVALLFALSFAAPVPQDNTDKQQDDLSDIARQLEESSTQDEHPTGEHPGAEGEAKKMLGDRFLEQRRRTAEQKKLLPEGTIIVSRAGRMVRSDVGGEWIFTFEADRDGHSDPPMVLMPCRNLQRMERLVEERPDATRFLVSGQVFVYYGRNYLLPTVMQVPYERANLSP